MPATERKYMVQVGTDYYGDVSYILANAVALKAVFKEFGGSLPLPVVD